MVIMSPFIYPDSSPCSAVIPPWVWYQLLFEQILSPCSISALPITLISGSKGHSKLFSYVRLIPCLLYLLPLSSYHVASNGNLCVLLPALPDQADLYSLTDTHCGTPVFILVLPLCPLTVLVCHDPNLHCSWFRWLKDFLLSPFL